jgi:protein SCO1/2
MGRVRTAKDFLGKYQLIYFGYSFCPDICPTALTAITTALEELGKLSAEVTPIFITIDPERDTPPHLSAYKESFHPSLVSLTGDKAKIQKALKAFRVYAQRATSDGTSTEYLMDHSSLIYLLDRKGKCIAFFSHTTSPQHIREKIKEFIVQEAAP